MPHIEVDLDGMKRVPAMAGVLGLPVPQVQGGLVLLWNWCWSEKTDHVRSIQIGGLFATPKHTELAGCLIEFGFLEEQADGWFRVRGAERYLRLGLGRTIGGKARVAGAKRDALGRLLPSSKGKIDSSMPSSKVEIAGPAAQQEPSSTTDHRTPITDHRSPEDFAGAVAPRGQDDQQGDLLGDGGRSPPKPKNRKRESDPRHHPLKLRLQAIFREKRGAEMAWSAAEAGALTRLLALAADDEIARRVGLALDATGYHRCSSVTEISDPRHWNHFAGSASSPASEPKRIVINTPEEARAYRKLLYGEDIGENA